VNKISELKPCKKAVEVTEKILELLEKEELTFAEVADVPAELEKKINKNTSRLKRNTVFKLPQ